MEESTGLAPLPPKDSVKDHDLFNQQHRLIVTNRPDMDAGGVRDHWARSRNVAQHVHNARPRAREHPTQRNCKNTLVSKQVPDARASFLSR